MTTIATVFRTSCRTASATPNRTSSKARAVAKAVAAVTVPLVLGCLGQQVRAADPPALPSAAGQPSSLTGLPDAPVLLRPEPMQLAQRGPRRGGTPEAAEPPAGEAPPATAPASPGDDARVMPPTELDLRPTAPYGAPAGPGYTGGSPPPPVGGGEFLPIPDRFRLGQPAGSATNVSGDIFNPYRQNVLKGDYPIFPETLGRQDIFFILGLTSDTLIEARRLPQPSGSSSLRPNSFDFFGNGESQLVNQNFILTTELFQGNTIAYRPKDLSFRSTLIFNVNYVHQNELGLTNVDVRRLHDRTDVQVAFQELFLEKKITDLSSNYDFVSVRAGIQGFQSDFRGFLFADNEPGVRLFGNYDNNRWQYNLAFFYQLEKDTNSGLNTTFNFRNQQVFIANLFRQDFLFPGYTAQLSFHFNHDDSGVQYDQNGFLVRPALIGSVFNRAKDVKAYYLGWAGDGHIGRFNITHQYYYVFGNEDFNPIAGRGVDISAHFFAVELSYDKDFVRYRASFEYASGDKNPEDGRATGFDSIFDNPNFAGGGLSFFTRQAIALTGTGTGLTGRLSTLPDLRPSKEQGQANFVNPGLMLFNLGVDVDVTPELKFITNASYLRFEDTSSIRLLQQDDKIGRDIGIDVGFGIEYRPLLNNNLVINAGVAALIPGQGFKDLYTSETLYSTFLGITLTY